MRKIILIVTLLLLPLFLTGCSKTTEKPVVEQYQLKQIENMTELKIEILKEGIGERKIKVGDQISVHYTGTLVDDTKFDSSLDQGQPFTFTIGINQVIQGWDQGLIGMKIGEKRKLIIPSSLAYGKEGAGALIPPNATLIFEVELISFAN